MHSRPVSRSRLCKSCRQVKAHAHCVRIFKFPILNPSKWIDGTILRRWTKNAHSTHQFIVAAGIGAHFYIYFFFNLPSCYVYVMNDCMHINETAVFHFCHSQWRDITMKNTVRTAEGNTKHCHTNKWRVCITKKLNYDWIIPFGNRAELFVHLKVCKQSDLSQTTDTFSLRVIIRIVFFFRETKKCTKKNM